MTFFIIIFYKYSSFILLLHFLIASTTYAHNNINNSNNNRNNNNNNNNNIFRNNYKIESNNNNKSNNNLAIFVFGDSTVDPGNNNYRETMFRSDHYPYGVDYPNHIPTGRFSNGMLATDFIASYAGIKQTIPAYLDPSLKLEDLITGVSFASAGSGYDPLTAARSNVIEMSKQLEYLDEYKIKVESKIGKKRMKLIMKHSIFVISCGSNDIMYTLGLVDSSLQPYAAPTYLHFLLDKCKSFLQGLMDRGAEKIAIVGIPPVGCLPAIITSSIDIISPFNPKKRQCVESLSSIATDFNHMLVTELNTLRADLPASSMLVYVDIYTPVLDQINHPSKYGFEEIGKGCCGSGLMEGSYTCNSMTKICEDRSKYIFWDSIHPSERSYRLMFEAIRPLVDQILARV